MRYKRLEELLKLTIRLQGRSSGMSLSDIMDEFNVSRSTAERMRNSILQAFPQIEEFVDYDRQKRYRLPAQTIGNISDPTLDELTSLKRAADICARQGDVNTADKLINLQDRLRSYMKSDSKRRLEPDFESLLQADGVASRPGPREIINKNVLSKIRDAILQGNWINIDHRGRSKKLSRDVDLGPLAMLMGEGTQYLVAWSEFQDDVRLFTLSGIERIEIIDEIFERPEDFDLQDYINQSFGIYQNEVREVEWKFSPEVADKAALFQFHPTQVLKRLADDSLSVTFQASGDIEMCWHLFRWGDQVEIVKPERLKAKYQELLKQTLGSLEEQSLEV